MQMTGECPKKFWSLSMLMTIFGLPEERTNTRLYITYMFVFYLRATHSLDDYH